jgi:peptidoglycan/LPS O-acetylase OafA/YrhL
VVYFLGRDFYWKHAALSFFYLMDYGRALAPESVQPWTHMWGSWSLAVEEKFYLLWPLLLLVLLKRPNLIRMLVSIILGLWVLPLLWRRVPTIWSSGMRDRQGPHDDAISAVEVAST